MEILRPWPHVMAFYAGRVAGEAFMPEPNWVDDGALSLGIASYAIVNGSKALVYDTHVSLAHARMVRTALEAEGITDFTVLLSHWHLDHVAGTEVFQDCEIIATRKDPGASQGEHACHRSRTEKWPACHHTSHSSHPAI